MTHCVRWLAKAAGEYNFPDKWVQFILNIPAAFANHRTQCVIEKVDALSRSIAHEPTLLCLPDHHLVEENLGHPPRTKAWCSLSSTFPLPLPTTARSVSLKRLMPCGIACCTGLPWLEDKLNPFVREVILVSGSTFHWELVRLNRIRSIRCRPLRKLAFLHAT
jgi:hypothetical protein